MRSLELLAPGIILPFAGSTAPNGWLLCAGQAVNRTTYAGLFAAIGTTFGVGDGATTFNVPDLRGRVAAGVDNMNGTAANRLTNAGTGNPGINGVTLGAVGGADRHTLTTAQLAAHNHNVPSYTAAGNDADGGAFSQAADQVGSGTQQAANAVQTANAGSGEAHPNVQPTIMLNQIIKT